MPNKNILKGGEIKINEANIIITNNKPLNIYDNMNKKKILKDSEKKDLLKFIKEVLPNIEYKGNKIGEEGVKNLEGLSATPRAIFLKTKSKVGIGIKMVNKDNDKDILVYEKLGRHKNIIELYGFIKENEVRFLNNNFSLNLKPELAYTYMFFELAENDIMKNKKFYYGLRNNNEILWLKHITSAFRDILNALKYMHLEIDNKYGLMHLDIKPDNIVYYKKPISYKLIDFGSTNKYVYKEYYDSYVSNVSNDKFEAYNKKDYKGNLISKVIEMNTNTPLRDLFNLFYSISNIFVLFPDIAYFIDDISSNVSIKEFYNRTQIIVDTILVCKTKTESIIECIKRNINNEKLLLDLTKIKIMNNDTKYLFKIIIVLSHIKVLNESEITREIMEEIYKLML